MLGSAFLHDKACFAQCCPTHFFTPGATCNPFTVCDICIRAAPVAACILQPCSMRRTSVCKNPSVSLSVTVDVWHFVYRICVDLFHQMPQIGCAGRRNDRELPTGMYGFGLVETHRPAAKKSRHLLSNLSRLNSQQCQQAFQFGYHITIDAKSRVRIAMDCLWCRFHVSTNVST